MLKTKLELMIASLGLATILGSTMAHAQLVVHSPTPQQAAAAIHAFWTAERMKAAIPMDAHATRPAPAAPSSAPLAPGTPGAAGGMLPTVGDLAPSPGAAPPKPASVPQPASTTAPLASGSYPGPNTTYAYGPKFRTYPISTVGRLHFQTGPTSYAYCTATVTTGNSTTLNVIWTAGHCVAKGDGSTWYSNWMFCPSYDSNQGGENPNVGCWAGTGATTTTVWFNNGNAGNGYSRDFAYVTLASSGDVWNTDVANVTGSMGFGWNQAADQAWQHYGYPGGAPWACCEIVTTTTEYRYSVTTDANGPAVNSWGSYQTAGSSGSALLLNFCYSGEGSQSCAAPWINSNVSFCYTSGSNGNECGTEIQGPYYDTFACQIWQGATGYSGTC
jgi:hypothetical protein